MSKKNLIKAQVTKTLLLRKARRANKKTLREKYADLLASHKRTLAIVEEHQELEDKKYLVGIYQRGEDCTLSHLLTDSEDVSFKMIQDYNGRDGFYFETLENAKTIVEELSKIEDIKDMKVLEISKREIDSAVIGSFKDAIEIITVLVEIEEEEK